MQYSTTCEIMEINNNFNNNLHFHKIYQKSVCRFDNSIECVDA